MGNAENLNCPECGTFAEEVEGVEEGQLIICAICSHILKLDGETVRMASDSEIRQVMNSQCGKAVQTHMRNIRAAIIGREDLFKYFCTIGPI